MKYRTLDENDDYTLGKNLFLIDKEAVAQAIKTKLLLLLGEWWENTQIGTPWFEKVLGLYGSPDEKKNGIDLVLSSRILEINQVEKITNFSSKIINRQYIAKITVETIYGPIDIDFNQNDREVKL